LIIVANFAFNGGPFMHFHLPKPLHGWREFVGEVGIIVVGVLIALGAEQVVEDWHWRGQVRAGRDALGADFINILANAGERQAEDRCIRTRLLFLRNTLNAHPDSLPAIGHVGSPPARPWYPSSWDSLVASDVSTHMSREDLLMFGSIAHQARLAEDSANREIEDWAVIYTMVGPSRPLAAAEAAQLRRAITGAAYRLNEVRLVAPQVSQAIIATGLLTKEDRAEADKEVAEVLRGPNARHICGPVMAADPTRVDAPYDPAVQANPLGDSSDKH
jgi:hypothetical protein